MANGARHARSPRPSSHRLLPGRLAADHLPDFNWRKVLYHHTLLVGNIMHTLRHHEMPPIRNRAHGGNQLERSYCYCVADWNSCDVRFVPLF